jgi:hypothetical protein
MNKFQAVVEKKEKQVFDTESVRLFHRIHRDNVEFLSFINEFLLIFFFNYMFSFSTVRV